MFFKEAGREVKTSKEIICPFIRYCPGVDGFPTNKCIFFTCEDCSYSRETVCIGNPYRGVFCNKLTHHCMGLKDRIKEYYDVTEKQMNERHIDGQRIKIY